MVFDKIDCVSQGEQGNQTPCADSNENFIGLLGNRDVVETFWIGQISWKLFRSVVFQKHFQIFQGLKASSFNQKWTVT
ncbi:hypothetical protein D3C80_1931540 [compost metagenome]